MRRKKIRTYQDLVAVRARPIPRGDNLSDAQLLQRVIRLPVQRRQPEQECSIEELAEALGTKPAPSVNDKPIKSIRLTSKRRPVLAAMQRRARKTAAKSPEERQDGEIDCGGVGSVGADLHGGDGGGDLRSGALRREVVTPPVVTSMQAIGKRDNQEDRILVCPSGLWAVADGMGGHADGEKAAQAAIDALAGASFGPDPAASLRAAFQKAHEAVCALSVCRVTGTGEHKMSCRCDRPGTTLTAVLIHNGALWLAHVGDSRILHSQMGLLTIPHLLFGMLAKAVGYDIDGMQIVGPLPATGRYVIASDGLETLPIEEVLRVMHEWPAEDMAGTLVTMTAAADKPRQDNVSVVAICFPPAAAEPRPKMIAARDVLTGSIPVATQDMAGEVLDATPSLTPVNVNLGGQMRQLWRDAEGAPLARDLDVAEWLGFDRTRNIRKLIDRHLPSLGPVCSVVEQTPGGGRPSTARYLTREQALYIAAKSETPNATAVLWQMITTFQMAMDGALPALPATTTKGKTVKDMRMTGKVLMLLPNEGRAWVSGTDQDGHDLSINVPTSMLKGIGQDDEVAVSLTVHRVAMIRRAEVQP